MEDQAVVSNKVSVQVEKGDQFSFVTYVDGTPTKLTGIVEVMMSSDKARALGLTKSKRRRLFLGLRVEGYAKLFWKDRGQVKAAHTTTGHALVENKESSVQNLDKE